MPSGWSDDRARRAARDLDTLLSDNIVREMFESRLRDLEKDHPALADLMVQVRGF